MPRSCMILAAGFGTRMGRLTENRPKPLIDVGGRPLIDHAIEAARAAAANPIVVNGHYRAEQLRDHLKRGHPDIVFLHETPCILDSGGGIKNALPVLGRAPVFTLNADAVWLGAAPLVCLEQHWDPKRMGGLLLLVPRDRAVGRQGGGDFGMAPDGRLFWNKGSDGLVYTGAQILDPRPIAAHRDDVFSLREIWTELMAEGRLFGVTYRGQWADVGHPDGLERTEKMLRGADV